MKVFGVKISWDTHQLVSFVINPNQFLKENASSERESLCLPCGMLKLKEKGGSQGEAPSSR